MHMEIVQRPRDQLSGISTIIIYCVETNIGLFCALRFAYSRVRNNSDQREVFLFIKMIFP